MELFKNFGIDPYLFTAQVINFLIIFYVMKRYLYKPILDMLKNREATIKTGLSQAEEARILLEQASEKERDVLKKAQAEAKTILTDAKKQSEDMLTKAEQRTKEQTDKMLEEARRQITEETREAEARLTKNISTLAVTYLQKSVEELFTDKEQDMVLSHALKTLKKKAD